MTLSLEPDDWSPCPEATHLDRTPRGRTPRPRARAACSLSPVTSTQRRPSLAVEPRPAGALGRTVSARQWPPSPGRFRTPRPPIGRHPASCATRLQERRSTAPSPDPVTSSSDPTETTRPATTPRPTPTNVSEVLDLIELDPRCGSHDGRVQPGAPRLVPSEAAAPKKSRSENPVPRRSRRQTSVRR